MSRITICCAAVAVAALSLAAPAGAQQPAPNAGTQLLLERLTSGATLEGYLNIVRGDFRNLDADAEGTLTPMDVEIHKVMQAASTRFIHAMALFRADLDGDGAVTADEFERLMKYDTRNTFAAPATAEQLRRKQEQLDNMVRQMMQADTDKDGRVTFAEAVEHGKRQSLPAPIQNAGMAERTRRTLTLDPDNKAVTAAAFEAAAEALFRTIDSDGDGKVSPTELTAFRDKPQAPSVDAQRLASESAERRRAHEQQAAERRRAEERDTTQRRAAAEAKAREGCELPRASENAKVVLLSNYETDAISTSTLGSQELVVNAGRIVVEPGDEPIYVVIASYNATIWQFSGAVGLIERVVLSSLVTKPNGSDPNLLPAVGVTGLPKDRITFVQRPNCVSYFSEAPSRASAAAAAWVRDATGKEPSVISADYSVQTFYVPSGKREKARDNDRDGRLVIQKDSGTLRIIGDASNVIVQSGSRDLLSEFHRFSPGGLVKIDPKDVVSSRPAMAYEVLPQQAGLLQLVNSGALSVNRSGEFLIHKKMRFPGGLHGAHSVKFLLLKGVPMPDGDPGHSDVMSEETGRSLKER